MTDEELEQAELKHFFRACEGLNKARQNGQPFDDHVEELDMILFHTKQAGLRNRINRVLREAILWKQATTAQSKSSY